MREWKNSYNPFNSFKALLHTDHLDAIVKGDFLPPVQIDLDPTNLCNFNCQHCNAWEARTKNPGHISKAHLLDIARFCGKWGVKGACISGGGEPLMNEATPDLIGELRKNGVESGVITNGTLLKGKVAEMIVKYSRWCGISVDASSLPTFNKMKGLPEKSKMFDAVLENIKNLVKLRDKKKTYLDIAFKFLIHPHNAHEIYDAAKLARELGVEHFHCRTAGLDNIKNPNNKFQQKDFIPLVSTINRQFEKMFELKDGHFEVFGVRHKFNPNFTRKVSFTKCWAIPLIVTFAANGNLELCFDRRGDKDLVMTSHLNLNNVLKYWNSPQHHKLIDGIDVKNCPRCTFGPYNEMIEQVIIRDRMCRNFP